MIFLDADFHQISPFGKTSFNPRSSPIFKSVPLLTQGPVVHSDSPTSVALHQQDN